ncbi:MAG: hypothetical protein GX620_11105 [Chloroflexi bacterium]|nr:hypothetical protein [Chloroflexota bacterium]
MTPRQDDIDALERAVMQEANDDVKQVLADARAKADRLIHESEAQSSSEVAEILQRARREVDAMRSHTIAAAQLDAQHLRLRRREEVLERVFGTARDELASITRWPDYTQILRGLIREGASYIGADRIVVHADPETSLLLTESFTADITGETNVSLAIGERLTKGTGVVLETPDRHRRYDNTFETRLTRMQDGLRPLVYRILMGDTP